MSENTFNLGTVVEDAKKIITDPVGFYREMSTEGGFAEPLIFVVVMGAISGLLISVLAIVGLGGGAMMAGGMAMAAIIMFPIMAVIGSFIGAAILFVIWKLMGSEKSYETAYRCTAYTMAIMPVVAALSIIPYLASIVRPLWSCFLLYVASTEVHNLKAQTAKIVFGILAAIGLMFGVGSERTARNFESAFEQSISDSNLGEAFKGLENIDEMTPEESGKAVGEFLKGLEKAAREAEEESD